MSFIRPVTLAAWLAFAPCAAQPDNLADALPTSLADVQAVEAAFAARNLDRGQQAAFLEFIAEDGVLFRPEAVRGRDWLAIHESATGRLERVALATAVSCDGRLALATGRWTYANEAGGEPAGGHYLTIWRPDHEGRWRVALEHRIDHAPAAIAREPLEGLIAALWPIEPPRTCDARAGLKDLSKADAALNKTAGRKGLPAALQRAVARGALVYRDDAAPARLGNPGPTDDARFGRGTVTRPVGMIVEPSTDLAVSYGVLVAPASGDGAPQAESIYMRVWNRVDRRWRLAIDLETLLPADRDR
jgi:ketosteroid isomerase-like protein